MDLQTHIHVLERELAATRALLDAATAREAEHARLQSELGHHSRVLDVVLSTLPDLICTFDLKGCFTYANSALLSVWQKPLEEIVGKNTFDLGYPPELATRIQNEVKSVIALGQAVRNRTPFTGAGGETRVYEYIFSPVLTRDQLLEGVTCTARDVTDHEQMAAALAASEEKLQQIFAQAPVAIVVFHGRDFVVEFANPFYQALIKGKELIGRRFADVVPELGKDVWDAFHRVLDTGEPFTAQEWHIPYDQNSDGVVEDAWFNVVYHPMRDATGAVSGMVAVCSDVSVQVRARQALERANRDLEEFAYVASHDLQEPLRMVSIYSELFLKRLETPMNAELQRYSAYITSGVKRMETLIRDLLSYSRTAHDGGETVTETADLGAALQQALMLLEPRIQETGAKIVSEALPKVGGNEGQLTDVFQNLLSNALKYQKPSVQPLIHIGAIEQQDRWTFSVTDNGIGFDPGQAHRIFGLFKRLHRQDEYPGTGLGLAICKRIIERNSGNIWAESQKGEGSTFYFCLPKLKNTHTNSVSD